MYVGVVMALAGETLLLDSGWMLAYAAAIWVGFDLFIRLYEEPTLRRRYGAEYQGYCAQVRRWWPGISPMK
jgi:protein-S-isoprenylcysteine O-methyltransferase Ste14